MIELPDPALRDGELGIVLRPWGTSPDDAEALAKAWADPVVVAETRPPDDRSTTAAAHWIAGEAERRRQGLALDLVVVDVSAVARRSSAVSVLGEVGLAHLDDAGRAEVGFWLFPEARGRGAAASAVQLVTAWALGEQGLGREQLWARVRQENRAAQRVLMHAGYTRLGAVAGRVVYSCTAVKDAA